MPTHKLHELASSVGGAVATKDVACEFLSISLNDQGKNFPELVVIEASSVVLPGIPTTKAARGSCEHEPTWGSLQPHVNDAPALIVRCNMAFA